jgi:UDP-glucose 4-epimerase
MSVLVTGGTGAIGAWVIRELIAHNQMTIAYDNIADSSSLQDVMDKTKIERADITDFGNLVYTCKKYEVESIIHAAAYLEEDSVYRSFKTNCEGTVNILEAARILDIRRIVYCSAFAALGHMSGENGPPNYKPVNEDYVGKPESFYGITKSFSENLGLAYCKKYGLDFVALRFSALYGPGRALSRHGRYLTVDLMVTNAMLGKQTVIQQGGDAVQDWTYIRDVARGIFLALSANALKHRVFHISYGQGLSLRQIAQTVREVFPKASIEIGPGLDLYGWGSPSGFVLDITRARNELGYEPKYSPREGLEDYARQLSAR